MTPFIAGYLVQDGLANGAIYCLLALAIVFVFTVTRVILIPQGDFVSYAALTYAFLRDGRTPGTVGFVVALVALALGVEVLRGAAGGDARAALAGAAKDSIFPLVMAALMFAGSRVALPALIDAALTVGLIASMGPLLYRLVYRPLAGASTLVLLMVSVALHLALVEMGLYFFGPGGAHTDPLVVFPMAVGGVPIQAQSLIIVATLALLIVALSLASRRTLYGKALRAAAINPVGARLMGVSAAMAGRIAFFVAAMIGAISGVLISAVTTITYDTGFLLGLKGFEAAVVGGLAVYPLAALGALGIGLAESFAAFFASAYKDAIVFALIIPALLWRSFLAGGVEEDEE